MNIIENSANSSSCLWQRGGQRTASSLKSTCGKFKHHQTTEKNCHLCLMLYSESTVYSILYSPVYSCLCTFISKIEIEHAIWIISLSIIQISNYAWYHPFHSPSPQLINSHLHNLKNSEQKTIQKMSHTYLT